ncbi:hypothetical protein [Kitasatospora sp. NPDC088346]|uniref:hypothetical protein n=1 Tax=Kitasatospora sp. NPDC088346 TaxID=3364073 RepID=UPI0038190A41
MSDITDLSGPTAAALDEVVTGTHRLYPDPGPHPTLDGDPISYVSAPLWDALTVMAAGLDPVATAADPGGTACDALRLIVAAAQDTADPDEPAGRLYITPSVVELGRRPVWLLRPAPRGPITAGFPADH